MSLSQSIGKKIRQARKEALMTQAQLAKKLKKSGAAIAYLEQGKRRICVDDLYEIADALGKPLPYFCGTLVKTTETLVSDQLQLLQQQLELVKNLLGKSEKEKSELEEMKNIYYMAFQNSKDGIAITDMKGKIIDCNDAGCRMYGYDKSELIGRNTNEFVKDSESFAKRLWKVLKSKGYWCGEVVREKRDGSFVKFFLNSWVIYDDQRRPIGKIGIVRLDMWR